MQIAVNCISVDVTEEGTLCGSVNDIGYFLFELMCWMG